MKHSRQTTYIDRRQMRARPTEARGASLHGSSVSGFKQTVRERPARMSRPARQSAEKPPQATRAETTQSKPATTSTDMLQRSRRQSTQNTPAVRHAKRSNVLRRHLVHKPKDRLNKQRPPTDTPKRTLAQKLYRPPRYALAVAGLVLLFGLVGVLTAFYMASPSNSPDESQVLSEQSPEVRDRPEQLPMEFVDETPRGQNDYQAYQVDSGAPRLLRINSIDVTALIKPVQVDMSNRLITPDNIFDVGWYEGSRQPGQSGVMLLNGHVAGANDRGALYYARALEVGDIIEVERGDGEKFPYEIKEMQKVPYDDINTTNLLIPHKPGTDGLNMVVVDNRYNVLNDEFQDRLVIYAVER